jgi:hypothetical protein
MHKVQLKYGYSDRLQIYVKKLQRVKSFQEKENPSFHKAYAGCITVWSHTYTSCITDRAHTYACCSTTGHVLVVFC